MHDSRILSESATTYSYSSKVTWGHSLLSIYQIDYHYFAEHTLSTVFLLWSSSSSIILTLLLILPRARQIELRLLIYIFHGESQKVRL
jgi:hypothetical protein